MIYYIDIYDKKQWGIMCKIMKHCFLLVYVHKIVINGVYHDFQSAFTKNARRNESDY